MAGLNLLANLLGASAKGETDGDLDGNGGDGPWASGAKRRGERESFNINLFPDDPFDEAQAKDDGEVCIQCVRYSVIVLLFKRDAGSKEVPFLSLGTAVGYTRWPRAVGKESLGEPSGETLGDPFGMYVGGRESLGKPLFEPSVDSLMAMVLVLVHVLVLMLLPVLE